MSFLFRLTSGLSGRKAGTDRFGNVYFESRRNQPIYDRPRRWVVYAGAADPTAVPPEWHAWLHHTTAAPLPEGKRYPWQQEHLPNLTGTADSYRPLGHDYVGGTRRVTGGDYEAWTPGS
ncbi:NADH-ubiquinone oxidoreductase subunit NDUFA12 family protein [Siccirubricoccus sp. G192]|uniref:NADH-ubiquinone oxidoreductase subunit NDUFA12 family protein n=1 Tax=Siccirubricoccus sp. G192 TaxID=2849651 RepID=UPI001C2C61A6|nr:NADH-ubiquinone oxidoreductase subunit NDUFA12 family protein [Siccirubricoccus sp. G192]MBV1799357.1 NADH:ubiquinone oxidoreductase subunit NDUFA12 [Siccirubricoccus sp. G192]